MLLRISCIVCVLGFLALLSATTPGQEKDKDKEAAPEKQDAKKQIRKADEDYRRFFKAPEKPLEFWAAIKFEIEVGKFELAAEYLKGMLAAKPADEDLLTIEEAEGMSAFLRLERIPKWSDDPKVQKEAEQNARQLVRLVSEALQKKLNDPERIRKYIKNLSATPEERAFAIRELQRSGAAAVPHLMTEFRQAQDAGRRADIASVLPLLRQEAVPPMIAALDIDDPTQKVELIKVLRQRAETGAVPYLWYLTAAPDELPMVRSAATAAVGSLLETDPAKLPQAKVALTREAERYYRHQMTFPNALANRRLDVKQANPEVIVWRWDGKQLLAEPRTESQAEEYYGLRFARQALELDPAHQPAQVVFLSMALDKGYERGGIDKPLSTAAPKLRELAATVNPELVTAVLERGLADNRLPVILGTVQTLGDLAEVRATQGSGPDSPPLIKALKYPDRRVQLAAADALLRIPSNRAQAVSSQIVEVLRRALAGDAAPKAAVADFNQERAMAVADAVRQAGFEPVVVRTGHELLKRLTQAADIDVVLIDHRLPDPEIRPLLAELRADVHFGRLPVLITLAPDPATPVPDSAPTSPGALKRRLLAEQATVRQQADRNRTEQQLRRLAVQYANVWVVPATLDADVLKQTLPARIADANGRLLTEGERKGQAAEAMIWLKRMATGEVLGYDVRPAEAAILQALRSDELAVPAIEAAGRLPGRNAQRDLAAVVLDNARRPELRSKAAEELTRHIQQHGLVLTDDQLKAVRNLFDSATDAKLKGNVALVIGAMRPDARRTGERLRAYTPTLPAPPPPPKEK